MKSLWFRKICSVIMLVKRVCVCVLTELCKSFSFFFTLWELDQKYIARKKANVTQVKNKSR